MVMILCVRVHYQFDKALAWSQSYTDQAKHSRLEVDEDHFHSSLLKAISEVDGHMEFNKTQHPQPMYQDKKDGTTVQSGWIYRCSTDCDGKIYRWDAWVSILGVVTPFTFPTSSSL